MTTAPSFDVLTAITSAATIQRWGGQLVKHVTVTRNTGLKGGWLRLENWLTEDGVPTGITRSRIEYPSPFAFRLPPG